MKRCYRSISPAFHPEVKIRNQVGVLHDVNSEGSCLDEGSFFDVEGWILTGIPSCFVKLSVLSSGKSQNFMES